MKLDKDHAFLLNGKLIEIWEGQHPVDPETTWKWNIKDPETGQIFTSGLCDRPEYGLERICRILTYGTLREMSMETEKSIQFSIRLCKVIGMWRELLMGLLCIMLPFR